MYTLHIICTLYVRTYVHEMVHEHYKVDMYVYTGKCVYIPHSGKVWPLTLFGHSAKKFGE